MFDGTILICTGCNGEDSTLRGTPCYEQAFFCVCVLVFSCSMTEAGAAEGTQRPLWTAAGRERESPRTAAHPEARAPSVTTSQVGAPH